MTPPFFRQRAVWSMVLLVLVGLGGGVWWAWQAPGPRAGGERPLEGLGNFGAVPDFALIERSGRRVRRADLRGFVWVANFFYATCPDTCPLQSARMARLQQDVADTREVRLVSISVDPQHDTPEVLRDYAQRFGADPDTAPSQAPEAPPVEVPSGWRLASSILSPGSCRIPCWPGRLWPSAPSRLVAWLEAWAAA